MFEIGIRSGRDYWDMRMMERINDKLVIFSLYIRAGKLNQSLGNY